MALTQLTGALIGLSILLLISVLLYLLLFRDNKCISVLFSIIIADYILSMYLLICGISHLFYGPLILTLSIITAILIWLIFKDKIPTIDSVKIDRSMILTVLLFAVFILAIQLIITYPFTSDVFGKYLPWARIIANEHNIPPLHLQNNPKYFISVAPLLYTHIALLFSLVGINAEYLTTGVPLFFSAATIFLVYTWSKEYNDKCVPLFAMLALLTSISFLSLSPVVLQEAPILFFATALFYLFFKYVKTRDNLHLLILSAASALLILTKESGLVIATLIFFGLLVKSRSLKEVRYVSLVFILLNILPSIWMMRNFYYFGNPVFPWFAQMFGGELSQYMAVSKQVIGPYISTVVISPQQFVTSTFITFPAIAVAFIYMYRHRMDFETQFVFICYIASILVMAATGSRLLVRYLYPFIGVFAVFAAVEMSKAYNWIFPKNMIQNKRGIAGIVISVLMIAFIIVIHSGLVTLYPYQNGFGEESDMLNYLQLHEGAKDVRIFGDSIPSAAVWYGNYTPMRPHDASFIVLNNGKIIYLNQTSDYYYIVFKKTKIDYVYDKRDRNWLNKMFTEINNDKEHFELVFNGSEIRLWKVK